MLCACTLILKGDFMKKLHKICAVMIVLVLLSTVVCMGYNAATIFKQNGFLYAYTASSKADLYGRETDDADLVIPKEFNEHYITNIVDSAFLGDVNIQSLSFSKATLLERIGYYAFGNCANLSGTVYIGGRINEIGTSAFQGCSSLESVIYRNNLVTVIADQCFYNCTSLSYVELPSSLNKIEKYAFANTALTEITIPDSVTSIDPTAFDGCKDLVIYCTSDSYAHEFAEANKITHVLTDIKNSFYLGDVDNNRAVEVLDVTYIQRSLSSLTIPESCDITHGDSDDDGEVSSADTTLIIRYLSHLDTDYPINTWIEKYEKHEF